MIGFGIVLAFAGAIVLFAAAGQEIQNRSYADCSEAVFGLVTRKRSRNVKNGKSYELTVSYTVNGIAYEKVVGALLSEYQAIAEGDKIELRYKPGNPKKAIRPMQTKPRNVQVVLITGAVLFCVGIALFIIGRL